MNLDKRKKDKISRYSVYLKGFNDACDKFWDILFDVEDDFWSGRSIKYNNTIKAQMEFAKELRKRISTLTPNNIIDK